LSSIFRVYAGYNTAMVKILHFADAHIDMSNYGQHDPISGLPMRVMDFLKSLDTIVDSAIAEKVDLVIFAGDTYKDRSPAPTFQREWGRRMMRLSRACIPVLLVPGNHDISPSLGRAHALQEYETLDPDYIHVVSQPELYKPEQLNGVQAQVIAIPWITRHNVKARLQDQADSDEAIDPTMQIEQGLGIWLDNTIKELDDTLPTILTAHASVFGAKFGYEQNIKIGKDLVLPPGFVKRPEFDYVALGHIHRHQDLNEGRQPPVVYAGSIERVDFGELNEDKGFVIAEVSKGHTDYVFHKLAIRPFIDRSIAIDENFMVNERIISALSAPDELKDAIVRLSVHYPREFETLIDETQIRNYAKDAFEFYLVKTPSSMARSRLPDGQETSSLSPLELLDLYWKQNHKKAEEREELANLAEEIISQVHGGESA
jgi:exonuclease SbcD